MSYARCVGRVGALAVALGIGTAIAGMPGIAWAGPDGDSPDETKTSQSPSEGSSDTGDSKSGDTAGDLGGAPDDGGDDGGSGDNDGSNGADPGDGAEGGMKVGSSGGQITSTAPGSAGAKSNKKGQDSDPPKKRLTIRPKAFSISPPSVRTTTQTTKKASAEPKPQARTQTATVSAPPQGSGTQVKQSAGPPSDVTGLAHITPDPQPPVTTTMTAVTKALAQSFVALGTTTGGKQPAPIESPLAAVLLAGGRQASRRAVDSDADARIPAAQPQQSGQLMATSATSAAAPTSSTSRVSLLSLFFRDTTKPTVSLAAPGSGGPVAGTVTLSATASDNVGVADVKFYVDNSTTALATDTTSPYTASWNTTAVTNGTHTVKAVARDAAGNTSTSTRTVTVDNAKPVVSLTAPTGSVSGTVALSATASDNVGVADVKFYVDNSTTALATDTTSPYTASWNTTTVANGAHTLSAVARDAAGNTTTSTRTVTVANPDIVAPTVSVSGLANGATVAGVVSLSANASDNVGVAGVQFYVNGAAVSVEDSGAPYGASWNTVAVANGSYVVTARARDVAGNVTTSAPVTVTVANPDIAAPTVVVSAPTGSMSGTVSLSATASDNVGVSGVQFFVDGNAVGVEDSSSPYGVSFNTTTIANGVHTVTARARDAAGNTTVSAPVSITVANPDITAPTVSLTGPANGASVSGTVSLTATASDNVGVSGVQFLVDNVALGAEDTSSPYSATWDTTTASNGTHTLTARARDAAGNTTTTSAVTVTVANAAPPQGPLSGTPVSVAVGSDPNGIAVAGNRGYVANAASDTLSVIDVNTNQTLATIAVGDTPTYVVATPDGEHVYVTNRDSNSVSIVATASNRVTHTITVGSKPQGVAVSADGSRLYVSNSGSNSVSVIDTATHKVVATYSTGASPNGLAVTPDGKLYVANRDNNTVSVLNAANGTVAAAPITVGSLPTGVAVNPAGTRVYVGNSSGTVSVISTASNTVIATVSVGSAPVGMSVSPDGSRVYVANSDDSVSVIDAATNTRIQHVSIDTAPENGAHYVAVSPDGTSVYVTDQVDRVVRAYSLANHAPAAIGSPTFGAANVNTGAVVGSLRVVDRDGNPLTYSVVGSPSSGSVTIDAANGSYTYTPNRRTVDGADLVGATVGEPGTRCTQW